MNSCFKQLIPNLPANEGLLWDHQTYPKKNNPGGDWQGGEGISTINGVLDSKSPNISGT